VPPCVCAYVVGQRSVRDTGGASCPSVLVHSHIAGTLVRRRVLTCQASREREKETGGRNGPTCPLVVHGFRPSLGVRLGFLESND